MPDAQTAAAPAPMPVPGPSAPADDALDAVLHLEAAAAAAGTASSAAHGAAAGRASGRATGWGAGTALQAELQYYHGAAVALLALAGDDTEPDADDSRTNVLGLPDREPPFPRAFPPRALAAARRVVALLAAAPLHERGNDAALDMAALAASVRAQMRAAAAALGLRGLTPPATAATSREAELSF